MVVSSSMCCLAARSFSKDGSWRWMHGWFTAVKVVILVSSLGALLLCPPSYSLVLRRELSQDLGPLQQQLLGL